MRNFIFSDPHFGQESLYKFRKKYNCNLRPEFSCAEEADKQIIENCNSVIPESGSNVYILGDLAKNITTANKYIEQLNGEHKFLVMGNHDCKFVAYRLVNLFDKIFGAVCFRTLKQNYIFTHIPIHPVELRGSINVHGHAHRNTIESNIEDSSGVLLAKIKDNRYINACLEPNNYFPIEITETEVIYYGLNKN